MGSMRGTVAILLMCALMVAPLMGWGGDDDDDVDGGAFGTVIVCGRTGDLYGVVMRLRAELENARLQVAGGAVCVPIDNLNPSKVTAVINEQGAKGLVIVRPQSGSVDIWTLEHEGHQLHIRQVVIPPNPTGADLEVVVLSVVELVRAQLLTPQENGMGEPARVSTAPPIRPGRRDLGAAAAAPNVIDVRSEGRFSVAIGLGGTLPSGTVGVRPAVKLGVGWRPRRQMEMVFGGWWPVLGTTFSGKGGRASIRRANFAARVDRLLFLAGRKWHLAFGAGWMVNLIWVDGLVDDLSDAQSRLVSNAGPLLSMGLGLYLRPDIRLRLDMGAGWMVNTIRVLVADQVVGRVGPLVGDVAVGLGVGF